jgi:hypothetical protein
MSDATITPAAPATTGTTTSGTTASGTTSTVGSYANYLEAQAAVDRLSDAGFPVEHVSIVGRDIRIVEDVTGRITKGKAALNGAGGGAWFGLLLGLLLGLFLPGGAWIALILSAVVFGAIWGALFGFMGQWATRGQRDFASTQRLEAGRYDVLSDSVHAAEATRLLGVTPVA